MNRSIPSKPSLEKDRKAAKALRKAFAAGEPEALARVERHHPRHRGRRPDERLDAPFRLADAQLVIAREYGVESWPRWCALAAFLREDFAERARLFLEAALGDDAKRANDLLAHSPELAAADIHTACAAGDLAAVRGFLERSPEAASTPGGPSGAPPLWTLCWSNVDLGGSPDLRDRVQIAHELLRAGADANIAADKDSDFGVFTASALYGTVERGRPALTKLLLERGADPNDGESVYHATEPGHRGSLPLLLSHGAEVNGSNALKHAVDYPDPAPVRQLLEAGADPNEVTGDRGENAFHNAARRGAPAATLDLLLEHGAELEARSGEGRTAVGIARRFGNRAAADHLRSRGATLDETGQDAFLGACATADAAMARALLDEAPDRIEHLSADECGVLAECARLGHLDAVTLMVELGFPIEAEGGDYPGTPLNHAAFGAQVEMVELLLAHGADTEAVNAFGGTVLGALIWSWLHPDGVDSRPRSEEERQRDLLLAAERLIDAGAAILSKHVGNAPPVLADLLRARGGPEPEDVT